MAIPYGNIWIPRYLKGRVWQTKMPWFYTGQRLVLAPQNKWPLCCIVLGARCPFSGDLTLEIYVHRLKGVRVTNPFVTLGTVLVPA